MPKQLTEYSLLFSCPGDAYQTCYLVIQEAVAEFNKYSKSSLGIVVNLTHWSTDSYPQSGGHPQTLLNAQIVDAADAAIAIFWTRFGTPTDEYGSGTEEEIERLLSDKKQVFLYFLDKAIPPSMTDSNTYREQRDQILLFRNKYEEKGIFCVVTDEAELREQFSRHLFLYFADQIANNTVTPVDNEKSTLIVTAADGKDELRIQHLNLSDELEIESHRSRIMVMIEEIESTIIPHEVSQTILDNEDTEAQQIHSKFFSRKEAKIKEDDRAIVLEFCNENEISIGDDFWYLGALKINPNRIADPFGTPLGSLLDGSDEEKRKYNLLTNLIIEVYHYNDRKLYCSEMDELSYTELIIQNKGTAFDEDIEVKLSIPNGTLLSAEEFPIPIFDLEQVNKEDKLREWICPIATADISEFDYSAIGNIPQVFTPHLPYIPFQKRDYDAEFRKSQKDYVDNLKSLFDWEVFQTQDCDIVKIRIRKLNQYKAMHFPARLFLKVVPEKIDYSITAKYTSCIIKGEITILE